VRLKAQVILYFRREYIPHNVACRINDGFEEDLNCSRIRSNSVSNRGGNSVLVSLSYIGVVCLGSLPHPSPELGIAHLFSSTWNWGTT